MYYAPMHLVHQYRRFRRHGKDDLDWAELCYHVRFSHVPGELQIHASFWRDGLGTTGVENPRSG